MLAKFKRPGLYINHGGWVFKELCDYPIKAKIRAVETVHTSDGFWVSHVHVQGVGQLVPDAVYMTRRAALTESVRKLKEQHNDLQQREAARSEIALHRLKWLEERIKAIQKHRKVC